jgi:hypothetical protein
MAADRSSGPSIDGRERFEGVLDFFSIGDDNGRGMGRSGGRWGKQQRMRARVLRFGFNAIQQLFNSVV